VGKVVIGEIRMGVGARLGKKKLEHRPTTEAREKTRRLGGKRGSQTESNRPRITTKKKYYGKPMKLKKLKGRKYDELAKKILGEHSRE